MNQICSILLIALSFAFTSDAFAKTLLTDVELKWKATTELKDLASLPMGRITSKKLKIEKFKDNRKEPTKVGENTEDGQSLPVTTTTDVAEFVTENLKSIYQKVGWNIVDEGQDATLSGEINEYFVSEVNTYKGSLIVKLNLKKAGKTVWTGVVIGNNTRFGRSYKLDNYKEVLSDTIIDAATQLAKNEEFQKAF